MQFIKIEDLKPHPRNTEFFDDITGDKWEDFKKSVVRRGVVESIVVTQDLTIVSGHQRVNACKELGILEIPCRVTHYPETDQQTGNSKEDLILEDLISTNILQRGIGNVNPMKMARCIVELERIYGIRQGNNQHSTRNNFASTSSQTDLAEQIGIDQRQLQNYKKLNTLIPELQDLVESDKLKATTAYKIWARLSKEEQEKFFNEIGEENIPNLTQKETEKIIKEKETLEEEYNKQAAELQKLKEELKNKPTEIKVKPEKEEIPEKIKLKLLELNNKVKQYQLEKQELEDKLNSEDYELEQLKKKEEKLKHEAHISMFDLQIKINKFIKESAPSIYLQGAMAIADRSVKKELIEATKALEDFVENLKEILNPQNISWHNGTNDNINTNIIKIGGNNNE